MPTRREFVQQMSAVAAGTWLGSRFDDPMLRVDGARLRAHLEALSVFGRPADGAFSDGVTRLGYSDADVQGRKDVMDLMRSAGLDPRIDAAGNIFARRNGSDAALGPILFGSHIDSVPSGGNFDGDLGSLAAIEAVRRLGEARVTTRHRRAKLSSSGERGRWRLQPDSAAAGASSESSARVNSTRSWNGVTQRDALTRSAAMPTGRAKRPQGALPCYIELHIEQGGNLDATGIHIGVVEGIVGIDRYEVTVTRLRQPRRHDADGRAPGRAARGVASRVAVNEMVTATRAAGRDCRPARAFARTRQRQSRAASR